MSGRSAEQVLSSMLGRAPIGWAIPADRDSNFAASLLPAATQFADAEAMMFRLLAEIDPRVANELLADWEAMLGPDPCGRDQLGLSDDDRRALVFQRYTAGGTVCAGFFVRAAAALGVALTITEFQRSACGDMVAGDELVPDSLSFLVGLPLLRGVDAVAGAAEAGDPLGSFTPSLMECVVRAFAPLHTRPVFSYS